MIVELFKYITNGTPKHIRKLGYLKESIAIEARYNRNKTAWSDHLNNTKKFIIETAEGLSSKKKAVILGSGSLYDVPLKFLSQNFDEVYLVDIVHLNRSKKIINKLKNVTLIEKDITGVAEAIYNLDKDAKSLPSPRHDFSFIDKNVDLLVSLNLLPQLPLLLKSYVEKKYVISDEWIAKFCFNLTNGHYNFLKRLSCEVCLITERERIIRDKKNNIVSTSDTLFGLKTPHPNISWDWTISPIGEYSKKYSITNKIAAYQKSDLI